MPSKSKIAALAEVLRAEWNLHPDRLSNAPNFAALASAALAYLKTAVDEDCGDEGPVRDENGIVSTAVVQNVDYFHVETFYTDGKIRDKFTSESGLDRDDFVRRASDAGLKVIVTPKKHGCVG